MFDESVEVRIDKNVTSIQEDETINYSEYVDESPRISLDSEENYGANPEKDESLLQLNSELVLRCFLT